MKPDTLKSDFILILVAAIWGLAFSAQRMGMDHVGPFTFNGLRFVLGALSLLPVLAYRRAHRKNKTLEKGPGLLKCGLVAGFFLFLGISFQQVGLVYTTAGKAGFITGLYVVIVPFLNIFFKQDRTGPGTWAGAFLACAGLYFLSVTDEMAVNPGDLLVLACAFCFSIHLMVIGKWSNRFDFIELSLVQCIVSSVLSLTAASFFETFVLEDIFAAAYPILYGGVLSVGVAYSLQIYGQKNAPSTHAAIIFSLESVVAAAGGWVILNEILTGRSITGCCLLLAGMLLSRLYSREKSPES